MARQNIIFHVPKRICSSPGEIIPYERELMRRYAVSRNTIRRALALLEKKNKVFRRPHGRVVVARYYDVTLWNKYGGKEIGISYYSTYSGFHDIFCQKLTLAVLRALHPTGLDLRLPSWNQRLVVPKGGLPPISSSSEVVGVILVGRQRESVMHSLRSLKKPLVSVDFDATRQGCDSFCFDNFSAGKQLARRLSKLGHREVIGIFESPDKTPEKKDEAWMERRDGFLAAWREMGLSSLREIFMKNRGSFVEVLKELRIQMLRSGKERPTALLLPADFYEHIFPLMGEMGLHVPRDLTVVGFTGTERPSELTAIRFDAEELGAAATKGLLGLLRTGSLPGGKGRMRRIKGVYVAGRTHAPASKTKV